VTRVTLWGITVGNEMENRERFEIVTKDFLSSNVPKNITIYTQESLGNRILETQVVKRDDLSVTILKVEIVGQIVDGQNSIATSNSSTHDDGDYDDDDGSVTIVNTTSNEPDNDFSDENEHGLADVVLTEDGIISIGVRVAPTQAGNDIIQNNAVIVDVKYWVTPYNPPSAFDYMSTALTGFVSNMQEYQQIVFQQEADMLGIAGLQAAESLSAGDGSDGLKLTFIEVTTIIAGLVCIIAFAVIYYLKKIQQEKSNDPDFVAGIGGSASTEIKFNDGNGYSPRPIWAMQGEHESRHHGGNTFVASQDSDATSVTRNTTR